MTAQSPEETTRSSLSPNGLSIRSEDVRKAARLISGVDDYVPGKRATVAIRTPLVRSDQFSHHFGCNVWLKLENLQSTGSYKVRGSFNNIANLDPGKRAHGVVTASAGNHAQGVANAAQLFGIAGKTTIFVPIGTPKVKLDNTRAFGVEVRETGRDFDQAREAAYEESHRSGRVFIEPFDDPHTIAGQGTVGLEILEELPATNAIIVPVGGGGLISGIAIATSDHTSDIRIIGVQAEGASSMLYSLDSGSVSTLPLPPTTQIADGIKVRRPGDHTYVVCKELLGRECFVSVPDIETVEAIADLMVYSRVIAEGAGAIGIAALRKIQSGAYSAVKPFSPDDDVVVVISGGSIDPSFSWRILYEQTVPSLLAIRVAMPDRPGELLRMLLPIAEANVNIIDVDVNRLDARPRMGERIVEVCVAIGSQPQADSLVESLNDAGYKVLVSRWQDPHLDRSGNLTKSQFMPGRARGSDGRAPSRPRIQRHADGRPAVFVHVVNKRHPLPRDYVPADLRVPDIPHHRGFELREPAARALERMATEAASGGVELSVISGYRSFDRQRELFERYCAQRGKNAAETFSARPGHSEHQTGLAVDLGDNDHSAADTNEAFAETPAGQWLAEHAHEFGFILRYPQGKSDITGFKWEPWHFRFVGDELARDIAASGMALEEYRGIPGGNYMSADANDTDKVIEQ